MKRLCCPLIVHGCFAAVLTVALYSQLVAQTTAPPRPGFSLRPEPQFAFRTWPGDFNRDGHTDLIAGARTTINDVPRVSDLLVALGRGDGSFATARSLGIAAQPLGTSDLNRDSTVDVVVLDIDGRLSVLPGQGDGTFGAPRAIALRHVASRPFALISDFNRDGHRDVVVGADELSNGKPGVLLFPGKGDLTFDRPIQLLEAESIPTEGVAGDFNRDGRRDFAVVTQWSSVFVFINRENRGFDRREIQLSRYLADITAADLNRDANPDLVIAASQGNESQDTNKGRVLVLLGGGYGAFGAPIEHVTNVEAECTIVAGDFNRDGRIDIATGNQLFRLDGEGDYQLWDSIAILPGDGTGKLLGATTYTIGRADGTDPMGTTSLNTSDLNGDRQTDLIASPGAILVNRATAPAPLSVRRFVTSSVRGFVGSAVRGFEAVRGSSNQGT